MRSVIGVVGVVALAVSVSCVSSRAKAVPLPTEYKGVVQPLVARFSGSCLVPAAEVGTIIPQAAIGPALAAILIPKAAGMAVDLVGGLLQSAGADKKTVLQASAGPYLYRVGPWNATVKARGLDLLPNARCLHLLSFVDAEDTDKDWGTIVGGTAREAEAIKLVQEALGMNDRPAPTFYMELAVVVAHDQSAFMLVPTFLKYGRGFAGRGGEAELVSAVSFAHPNSDKHFASTTLLLRDLQVGRTYDIDSLLGSWSEWMPLDRPSESASEARGRPAPSGTEEARQFDPINVKTVLTETKDGIKLLKALGELISGTKEDVAKAVGNSLPSNEKRDTEAASRLDDRNAYLTAMAEVKVKEAELTSKTDALENAKAEAELTKAKLTANKAALKAGAALPFGELYTPTER